MTLILAVLIGLSLAERARVDHRAELDAAAAAIVDEVVERVDGHVEVLRGLRALYQASEEVTYAEFQDWVEATDVLALKPGLQALSFNRYLLPGELADFESAVVAETGAGSGDMPPFAVHPRPGPETRDLFVVQYIEPLEGNEAAWGFDIGSVADRRAAAELAVATGGLELTEPIRLVQETGDSLGLLALLPVDGPTGAPEGVVVGVYRFDGLLGELLPAGADVAVRLAHLGPADADVTARETTQVVHSAGKPAEGGDVGSAVFDLGGRRWELSTVRAATVPEPGERRVLTAVGLGALVAALLSPVLWTVLTRGARRFERELAGFIELSADPALLLDADQEQVLSCNAAAIALFGWDDGALPRPVDAEMRADLQAVLQGDEEVATVSLGATAHGRPARLEVRARRVEYRATGLILVVGRDVAVEQASRDAMARALEAQRDANQQLQQADRMKDEFLDVTAHELRSPLAAIHGFAELLSNGHVASERTPALIARIYDRSLAMRDLVDRLLDFSRLRAGRIHLDLHPVRLAPVVIEVLEARAEELATHATEVAVADDVVVRGDEAALGHILANLVGNAARYSEPGSTIRIEARPQMGSVLLSVSDEGIGIPADELHHLFERFYRASSTVTSTAGIGIGLSIVERYVDLLGATIDVQSTPGRGSTFTVRLPAAVVDPA